MQANFAQVGKVTAIFCLEHRSPGMVDVKGPRCTADHCVKVAGYGVQGHRPSACILHRAAGMVEMKHNRTPRRPRRVPATNKPRGFDINLVGGGGSGSGDTARLPSRGTGVKMPGARDLFDNKKAFVFPPSVSGLDSCSEFDNMLRPASTCDIGGCGGGNSSRPQQRVLIPEKISGHRGINGRSSNDAHNNDGQGLRSWGLETESSKAATSCSSSVPTVSIWAFDGQAGDSGNVSNNDNSNGAPQQQQQLSSSCSHWTSDRAPNQYSTPASYHQLSEMVPTTTTTTPLRGSTSVSALNRFDGGSGGGGDGLFSDEERNMDVGEWRSSNLDDNDNLQEQLSVVSAAMDQPEYGEPPVLCDDNVRAGGGGDRTSALSGINKVEQELMTSRGVNIPEVESVDTWLTALLQGPNTREISNPAPQQRFEAPSPACRGMMQNVSHQHTRRFGNPQSMNLGSTTASPKTGGSFHSVQQHQRQQSNSLGSMLSLGSVTRTQGKYTTAARISSTISLSAASVVASGRSPSIGSIVSMGSCGASPPIVPGTPNDTVLPQPSPPQGFRQDDLVRGRAGGGFPGVASSGVSVLRAKASGVAPEASGPPPNNGVLTRGVLSGMTTGGGRGRCDMGMHGHGIGGFNSDMHFSPLKGVVASPAWGGGGL